jgi:hypothetical protein
MALHSMHWAPSVIAHSQPESVELVFNCSANVLSSKSLIFRLLVVGGYDLSPSAIVMRTFGAGGVDGNIWGSLSVFACCSFLASLSLFIMCSDRTGHQNTYPSALFPSQVSSLLVDFQLGAWCSAS